MDIDPAELTVLTLLMSGGRMGRYLLSLRSGLGEGTVRRILSRLRAEGLVRVSRGGAEITESGMRSLVDSLRSQGIMGMIRIDEAARMFGEKMRCYASSIMVTVSDESVISLRDTAIREGNHAVLILGYECADRKLNILRMNRRLDEFDPDLAAEIINKLNPGCGYSVVIVCGPNDYAVVRGIVKLAMSIGRPTYPGVSREP